MAVFWIKFFHSAIFLVVSAAVVYLLYSGITNHLNTWTWVALVLVLFESVVLVASCWKCPLTLWAERHGAVEGSVAQIFLPRWFVGRMFLICGLLTAVACIIVVFRLFTGQAGQ